MYTYLQIGSIPSLGPTQDMKLFLYYVGPGLWYVYVYIPQSELASVGVLAESGKRMRSGVPAISVAQAGCSGARVLGCSGARVLG